MSAFRYIADCALAFMQRRCRHPSHMVASDLLEGCVEGLAVKYCRRCGAVQTDWSPHDHRHLFISLDHTMRRPDPHLWRSLPFAVARFLPRWAR